MDEDRRKALEASGWQFGDADDFLTDARKAMRPELRKAAEASWKHGQDGLRYLAEKSHPRRLDA